MAILKSYYKMYRTLPEPDYFFIKNEYTGNNTLKVDVRNPFFNVGDGEYKLNDGNWTPLVYGQTNSITIPANGKVYFRATNWGRTATSGSIPQFSCTQNYSAGGNVMSLNDYTNVETTTMKDYLCYDMFNTQTKLIKADFSIGNVTSVGTNCFYSCFQSCSNLTTIPDFGNIESTTGTRSFYHCFYGCKALTTAPDFSNVTNVNSQGFYGCFYGCTALTTAPDFSNVISVDYDGFDQCFMNCSKLNYVYAPNVTSWDTGKYDNWLSGVASYGIIRKKSSLTIPTGNVSACPANWEFENY